MRWSSEFIAVYAVVVLSSGAVSRYKESKKLSGGWVRLTVPFPTFFFCSFKIVNIFPLIFLRFYYIMFVFPVLYFPILPHLHVLSSLFASSFSSSSYPISFWFIFIFPDLFFCFSFAVQLLYISFFLSFFLFLLFPRSSPLFLQHNKDVVLKPLRTAWSFVSFLIKI